MPGSVAADIRPAAAIAAAPAAAAEFAVAAATAPVLVALAGDAGAAGAGALAADGAAAALHAALRAVMAGVAAAAAALDRYHGARVAQQCAGYHTSALQARAIFPWKEHIHSWPAMWYLVVGSTLLEQLNVKHR